MTTQYRLLDANGREWNLNDGDVTIQAGAEGFDDLETDSFTRQGPFLDGQVFTGWKARPRRVFLPVMISGDADSFPSVRRDFLDGLRPGAACVLRVTTEDAEVRELTARYVPEPFQWSIDPTVMKYERRGVSLIADDPFWRGPTQSRTFQTAEDQLPFYATDSDRVFNLLSSSTTGSTNLENPGEVIAWPTIRIDGPATAFSISKLSGIGTNSSPNLAGEIEIAEGQWLFIDQRPTVQTAFLYPDTVDVTSELDRALFFPIAPDASTDIDVELTGAGSLTVSFEPGYFRAF